jgi:hypothetical protein
MLGHCQINHSLDVIATVVQQIIVVGVVLEVLFACTYSVSHYLATATVRISRIIRTLSVDQLQDVVHVASCARFPECAKSVVIFDCNQEHQHEKAKQGKRPRTYRMHMLGQSQRPPCRAQYARNHPVPDDAAGLGNP